MSNTTTMSARNKKFWAMSPEEQRVAVAKDVLKVLSSKFAKARRGTYLGFRNLSPNWEEKPKYKLPKKADDLFTSLNKSGATCAVCGIGACFLSAVRLGDKLSTNKLLIGSDDLTDDIDTENIRPLLRKIFVPSQLSLIESAFEKDNSFRDYEDTETDYHYRLDACVFGKRYDNDTVRLKAIMNNIIANKGTFKP